MLSVITNEIKYIGICHILCCFLIFQFSLGCEHDGDGNSCSTGSGYAMETSFILANKNKWRFSSCSVNYIQNYLNYLNTWVLQTGFTSHIFLTNYFRHVPNCLVVNLMFEVKSLILKVATNGTTFCVPEIVPEEKSSILVVMLVLFSFAGCTVSSLQRL